MSGHSHFSSIKHKKATTDAKRSKVFSKLSQLISVAAREKGGEPETNAKLRLAVDQAKAANMPSDNIERAIKKGSGELGNEKLEEVLFEAYGPGGLAVLIEGITDNKNRALGEVKQILSQHNGKLAGSGSVQWLFERKGCITISPDEQLSENGSKESLELTAIESGAQDIYWHNDNLDIYTKQEELEEVKKKLEEKGIKINSASLDWAAKEEVDLPEKDKESCQKLFEALDENDSVQGIYSNLKL